MSDNPLSIEARYHSICAEVSEVIRETAHIRWRSSYNSAKHDREAEPRFVI